MIFENCGIYLSEKLDSIFSFEEWKEKKVVIYSISYLGRTTAAYFLDKGIRPVIVDTFRHGMLWYDMVVQNPAEIIPDLDENSVVIITYPDSRIRQAILDLNNSLEKNIFDVSDYRIENIPEKLDIPSGYRKTDLEETHNEVMDLLGDFHDFCKEHNLRYFVDYGSLLGTIRHKGFIPWDDDMDVSMPIKDYFEFCRLYKPSGDTVLLSQFSDNSSVVWPSTMTKLTKKTLITKQVFYPLRFLTPIGMDIFPVVGFPFDTEEQLRFGEEMIAMGEEWRTKIIFNYGKKDLSDERNILVEKMKEIMLRYDYDSAEYIGIAYFCKHMFNGDGNRALPKKWYRETKVMDFEKYKVNVPSGYDSFLSYWYGDYMKLPPEEKRVQYNSYEIYKLIKD